jgi:hypothetical protein
MRAWLAGLGITRIIALVLVAAVAVTYGFLAVRWQRATDTEIQRITRVVEGTPGPEGEPGIGVSSVLVHTLPPGFDPRATLRHGLLTLWIPLAADGDRGATGPRGPQGPHGPEGLAGKPGKPGEDVSVKQIRAIVESVVRSLTFRCKLETKNVFTCRVS